MKTAASESTRAGVSDRRGIIARSIGTNASITTHPSGRRRAHVLRRHLVTVSISIRLSSVLNAQNASEKRSSTS